MAAVDGSVLSTTLQVLFDRIALNKNFLLDLFPGNKKLHLKRLERVLQIVSQFLQDAENKQDKSPAVKSWFNSLKHEVYQADDVLDEINIDRLRIQVQHSKGHLSDTNFSDQFIGELSPRLEEICEELERKVQKIGVLGLQILNGEQKREEKPPTTSVVKQSQICGRDDEKEKIIQMVLSSEGDTNISVIPIIGMGGIGKTTLAQHVYNDERVKIHFKTRAWACVSEEFDVYRVTKDLLNEVNSSLVDEKDDLECLQVKLKKNLEVKRFIIILDDIWNENFNDYQRLMTPLHSGSRGSKIIVTTRNESIALMLQNQPFHRLEPISYDQSWSLFKLHAFDNRTRTLLPEFERIGKTMVKKCKGLPLAIKTVAGALRSKEDIREWRDMLSNDNWMVEGDILPALSLSYKLLPSHLKCCFAFCAVFAKDKPFDKEEAVLLWMANDLVQPSSQKVAENYFEELRARSFFEMAIDNNKYVMHDLINDLARHVSGYFCARMEDCQLKDVHRGIQVEYDFPPEVLHFSYLTYQHSHDDTLRGLAQVQGLRTFLGNHWNGHIKIFFTDVLSKLRHIRALSLQQPSISVIPDSIGDLKHLRLLNLAGNNNMKKLPNGITKCLNLHTLILADCWNLEELPEDMGHLFNLQTLILAGCERLKELPEDMGLLINLQTLNLAWCRSLKELPEDMGLLINLQTLILVGCSELKELPEDMGLLINLQHLDVRNAAKMEIWLSKLKDIQNLSIVVDKIHGSELEQMDQLQLGQLLTISELDKGVTIELARSAQLMNMDCIEELILGWSNIPECSDDLCLSWSSEDELPECSNIQECLDDWDILAELRPHTNIRKLEIRDYRGTAFPNWVGDSSFCNLEKLTLFNCWKCIHLPPLGQLTGLKTLQLDGCNELESLFEPSSLRPDGGLPPSLLILEIWGCKKLMKFLRNWGLQRLPSLIKLTIQGIEDELFPEEGLLPATLKYLTIRKCPNLEALNPKGFQDITSLQQLHIYKCPELRCLLEDGLPSSLYEFTIWSCPKLEGRLEREKGEDWPKVMHIPDIQVDLKQI